jgi:hypothetical protein
MDDPLDHAPGRPLQLGIHVESLLSFDPLYWPSGLDNIVTRSPARRPDELEAASP